MALENFTAAAAELNSLATDLIAKCGGHEATIAQLQSDLANADQTATAAIQPTIDALKAADPA